MAKKKVVFRESVPVEGKTMDFVVFEDEAWTFIDDKGKYIPPIGILPMEDIEKLRGKAAKKGT
jgi:hypothetical protein